MSILPGQCTKLTGILLSKLTLPISANENFFSENVHDFVSNDIELIINEYALKS